MFDAVTQAFKIPDLRRKIFFTLGILILFRIIASIPVPGVDRDGLADYIEGNQLLGMLNLFSGSGLRNFSIVAMGVYPYITATIIMQLLIPIIPQLEALSKEGESGRAKINQYMHWVTVPLAALQGFGTIQFLNSSGTTIVQDFDLGTHPIETLAIIVS